MALFCYIVYELLVGLAAATAQESDAEIRCKIQTAQVMTVFSRCTYQSSTFPMLGINAALAFVSIQVGAAPLTSSPSGPCRSCQLRPQSSEQISVSCSVYLHQAAKVVK